MDSYLFLINFLFFPLSFGSNYGSSKKGLKPKKRGGGLFGSYIKSWNVMLLPPSSLLRECFKYL